MAENVVTKIQSPDLQVFAVRETVKIGKVRSGLYPTVNDSLFMINTDGKASPFVQSAVTGTAALIPNIIKFPLNAHIFTNLALATDSSVTNAEIRTTGYVDIRFSSCQYNAALFPVGEFNKVYMPINIDESTGTFTLKIEGYRPASTTYTTNLTAVGFKNGTYYMFIGYTSALSTAYTVMLVEDHPIYYYDGANFIPYEVKQINAITSDAIWERGADELSTVLKGLDNSALAPGALAEGYRNSADSSYSHAEGWATEAEGTASHSEGSNTKAKGISSHAEGNYSYAEGNYSHAEGADTHAYGDYSHAEGSETIADGNYSHTEGELTHATGDYSHAEGNAVYAIGDYSHAEGSGTLDEMPWTISGAANATTYTVNDPEGDFIGFYTGVILKSRSTGKIAKILSLVDQGSALTVTLDQTLNPSTALSNSSVYLIGGVSHGIKSHSEGSGTTASGSGSHAEGISSIATGDYSHAEGSGRAFGTRSHAEGSFTVANAQASHAEGDGIVANARASHAEGKNTITYADAEGSHAEGVFSKTRSRGAHAEGYNTDASGLYSHAEGSDTAADGSASHAEGSNTYAKGISSHAEGNYSNAEGNYSHAEGADTYANGDYSHAEGSETIANGDYSHAEGELTYANGDYSHAEGASNIVDGGASHAEGYQNVVTGDYAHVEGQANSAYGDYSHAEGKETIVKGGRGHAEGLKTVAYAGGSHAEGFSELYTPAGTNLVAQDDTCLIYTGTHSLIPGQVLTKRESNAVGSYNYRLARVMGTPNSNTVILDTSLVDASGASVRPVFAFTGYTAGTYSHTEGVATIANTYAEHAEGTYNISHVPVDPATGSISGGTYYDSSLATIHTVGIGESRTNRRNAIEIMHNGDMYLYGAGSYDGSNFATAATVQELLNNAAGNSSNNIYYTSATVNSAISWSATVPGITSYYDGLKIVVYNPSTGNSSVNLSLNINGLGDVSVVRYGTTGGVIYGGAVAYLCYAGGKFRDDNYVDTDANTTYDLANNAVKIGRINVGPYPLSAQSLFMFDTSGYAVPFVQDISTGQSALIPNTEKFNIGTGIYTGLASDANATLNNQIVYCSFNGIDIRYSSYKHVANTLPNSRFKPVYMPVTVNDADGTFTLKTGTYSSYTNNFFTLSTIKANNDYIFVGYGSTSSTSYNFYLALNHPLYHYDGSTLIPYDTWRMRQADVDRIYYANATSTSNTAALCTIDGITSYYDGLKIALITKNSIASRVNLNVNNLGDVSVLCVDNATDADVVESLTPGSLFYLCYSGGKFFHDRYIDTNTETYYVNSLYIKRPYVDSSVFQSTLCACGIDMAISSFTTSNIGDNKTLVDKNYMLEQPILYWERTATSGSVLPIGQSSSREQFFTTNFVYMPNTMAYYTAERLPNASAVTEFYMNVTIDTAKGTFIPTKQTVLEGGHGNIITDYIVIRTYGGRNELLNGHFYIYLGKSGQENNDLADAAYMWLAQENPLYYCNGTYLVPYDIYLSNNAAGTYNNTVAGDALTESYTAGQAINHELVYKGTNNRIYTIKTGTVSIDPDWGLAYYDGSVGKYNPVDNNLLFQQITVNIRESNIRLDASAAAGNLYAYFGDTGIGTIEPTTESPTLFNVIPGRGRKSNIYVYIGYFHGTDICIDLSNHDFFTVNYDSGREPKISGINGRLIGNSDGSVSPAPAANYNNPVSGSGTNPTAYIDISAGSFVYYNATYGIVPLTYRISSSSGPAIDFKWGLAYCATDVSAGSAIPEGSLLQQVTITAKNTMPGQDNDGPVYAFFDQSGAHGYAAEPSLIFDGSAIGPMAASNNGSANTFIYVGMVDGNKLHVDLSNHDFITVDDASVLLAPGDFRKSKIIALNGIELQYTAPSVSLLGQGYGVCSSHTGGGSPQDGSTLDKGGTLESDLGTGDSSDGGTRAGAWVGSVTLSGYVANPRSVVAVYFPSGQKPEAGAYLNINSEGEYPIYFKGSPVGNRDILADTIVCFMFDGTSYNIIAGHSEGDFEMVSNKTNRIDSSSTTTQYPNAKCIYNIVGNIEAALAAI